MATRTVSFVEGEYYHVYNRGVDKRVVFQNKADHMRFLQLLYLANTSESINVRDLYREYDNVFKYKRESSLVAIGAYCLMPNHYHLLLTPLVENGISLFMKKLATGYSMYFNKKYERDGALFAGNFKARHTDSDEYLRYLYAYIHLNSVKLFDTSYTKGAHVSHEVLEKVKTFPYSSLVDYLGATRIESEILSPKYFPGYFVNANDHLSELSDWIIFENLPPEVQPRQVA